MFIPSIIKTKVLQWIHSHRLTCHPGTNLILAFIKKYFGWLTFHKDVKEFVCACTVCTRNKNSNQPPAGLLQPLPSPSHPWSHIALEFLTGPLPSDAKTVILTIVDRFSKSAHFVSLVNCPLPLRQPNCWWIMFFASMTFPHTQFQTEVHNSSPKPGGFSVGHWEKQGVWPWDYTHSQLDG